MLISILIIFTLLIFWQFLGYPLFMAAIYSLKKNRTESMDYSYQPFVSIIIPVYNESRALKSRIGNLLALEYPEDKYEIIIVDSGSIDNSVEIARSLEKSISKVTVLEEGERRGKASAINYGKSFAQGEIILITDANTIFDKNVLKEITPHFSKPEVGAVGGRFIPLKGDKTIFEASVFYWELESLIRRGESAWKSTCLFHGEINAWRKNIIEADTKSLAEDLDMAVTINRKGFRIIYVPDALAYEAVPATYKEQVVQKKRTLIGTIQGFFKHNKYLLIPRDRYSWIIFPSHKTLQILSPFLIIGWMVSFTFLARQNILMAVITTIVILILFIISFFILNRNLFRYSYVGNGNGKSPLGINLLSILIYVALHEYIIMLAWKDYITGDYRVQWELTRSTRNHPEG
ncbi:glycosyltransferase [Chloroflexota bacterium]